MNARRALEALRAGVPNRDAVEALGSLQTAVEDRFSALLATLADPTPGEPAAGMLLGGGFGSGKSHVLEHLAHQALDANFVVSKVVVSKETALHDPVKVFRAAIDEARLPDRAGSAIDEVAAALQTGSAAYASLYRWLHSGDALVDARFGATPLPVRVRPRRPRVRRPHRALLGRGPAPCRRPAPPVEGGGRRPNVQPRRGEGT